MKNWWSNRGKHSSVSRREAKKTNWPGAQKAPWWVTYDLLMIPRRKLYVEKIIGYKPETVLELGCCGGANVNHFPKDLMKNITAVDFNQGAIKFAKSKKLGCNFLHGDITEPWNKIDIQDKKFDIVCSMGVLIHIPINNIDFVLKNMIDSCSKGIVLIEGGIEEIQISKSDWKPQRVYNLPERINKISNNGFNFKISGLPDSMKNEDTRLAKLKIIEAIRK